MRKAGLVNENKKRKQKQFKATKNETMNENKAIVEDELRAKGIPTMIYDGKRHTGIWHSK